MPDFDIDFCQERRDEVMPSDARIRRRPRGAIITFGKLQARAAVAMSAGCWDCPMARSTGWRKLIPITGKAGNVCNRQSTASRKLQELRDSDEGLRRLMEIALQLEGLYRHCQHPCRRRVIATGAQPIGAHFIKTRVRILLGDAYVR